MQDLSERVLETVGDDIDGLVLFGSMARGDADENSDVDLLVTPLADASLLDLGGLLMDAQDLLGRRVDVVSDRALHPQLRERILAEAVPL